MKSVHVEVCHNIMTNNCKRLVGHSSRSSISMSWNSCLCLSLCGGCKVCFTHSPACIVCGLSAWVDEGIPEQCGGQSKHPEQSLTSIVKLFFSGRLPPTAAQLGPTPLSSPSSASLSLALTNRTHTHTQMCMLANTHTHIGYPQGLVTIPAGYLLSPSNQHLCNFWPCTSSLDPSRH